MPLSPKNDYIKASELSTFVYCHRAWWYERIGEKSNNLEALNQGVNFHLYHAKSFRLALLFRRIAILLMVIAGILFIVQLLWLHG